MATATSTKENTITAGTTAQYYRGDKTWQTFNVSVAVVVDGGGAAITTGVKLDVTMPFNGTIVDWTILADQTGSIQFDLWKVTYANFPATVANTITASAKPVLSAAAKATSSTLTGWTTAITAGDVIRINVDSAATVQRVTLSPSSAAHLMAVILLTSGTSWTVPSDCTSAVVECYGGGGGGGSGTNSYYPGGGGGGAYSSATVATTPGASISYAVGGGGAGKLSPGRQTTQPFNGDPAAIHGSSRPPPFSQRRAGRCGWNRHIVGRTSG